MKYLCAIWSISP